VDWVVVVQIMSKTQQSTKNAINVVVMVAAVVVVGIL